MSFFSELFSRSVSVKDLRRKLEEVERERRRGMLELKKLAVQQTEKVEAVKRARKDGNALEIDYLWEDLKAVKAEAAMIRRELRVWNLEGISLKRYIRGLERLERAGDKESARKLIERIRNSGLDSKLAAADINDREYLAELQQTLDGFVESDLAEEFADDPEKLKFLAQIDEINAAEDAGDLETAIEKEARLRSELEREGESA